MNPGVRRWAFLMAGAAVVVGVDQATKWWVLDNLLLNESRQPIPALAPFFQITRSYNTGSAFGFLPQASDLFLVIAVVVIVAIFYFYPRIPAQARLTRTATALITGGALGNALDRLQHGLVVDFIHYQIPGLLSNVSNLADHAIVLGVALIFLDSWRSERRARREKRAAPQAAPMPALEADPREDD